MPPLSMLIKPASSLCNMRCSYCFYADVSSNREVRNFGMMTDQTLETLVRKALAYADGSCTFAFQGGEPTLAGLDFYKRLTELQKKYNHKKIAINNCIQTNGYLITEEWAEFFANNHFLVGISLDGPEDIHNELRKDSCHEGTFKKVINATKLFDFYNVDYNILSVVTSLTAKNAKRIYNFYRQNNYRYIQYIQCLDDFDGNRHDYTLSSDDYSVFLKHTFDEYYKDFKNNKMRSVRTFDNYLSLILGMQPESCDMSGSCRANIVIESNGNVYPCDFYVLDDYITGNINTDSFKKIVSSSNARKFVEQSHFINEECRQCRWLNLCRGGCRRCREPFTDNHPSLNKFCSAYKSFFNYSIDRFETMAQTIAKREQQGKTTAH